MNRTPNHQHKQMPSIYLRRIERHMRRRYGTLSRKTPRHRLRVVGSAEYFRCLSGALQLCLSHQESTVYETITLWRSMAWGLHGVLGGLRLWLICFLTRLGRFALTLMSIQELRSWLRAFLNLSKSSFRRR